MAKPNYSYEKRARELAKKQKKEEKLQRRKENAAKGNGEAENDSPSNPEESGTPTAE